MQAPAIRNYTINKGSTFNESLKFYSSYCPITDSGTTLDLSAYSFASQIRASVGSTVIETFTINTDNAATGEIFLQLSDTETSAVTAGTYLYDLKVTDTASNKDFWVKGTITFVGVITTV